MLHTPYGWWPAVSVGVLVLAVGAGLVLRDPPREPATGPPGDAIATTTRQLPPAEQPSPRTVRFIMDAAEHPDRDAVQDLLQSHFDAINFGEYSRWTSTVVTERAEGTPEDVWREQYATSTDVNIVVHRMEPRPGGGLTVLLSFNSVQDPDDAPEETPFRCLRWHVSYPVVTESDQLLLGPGDPDTSRKERCS
ncbi:MAG: hypothetical protein GEU83_16590 [Pseudonocardiaceae bacterium]|nr:hypothetical protein [Pseudonocardiaceae bacterium]